MAAAAAAGPLKVASWNIAAVNNNPFEYWITHDDAAYNTLMEDVQQFIDSPGAADVPVHEVLTDGMFKELLSEFETAGWGGEASAAVEKFWTEDFRARPIIAGFMKDKSLGSKRLASMPDRMTNTIQTTDGVDHCRPTVSADG